MFKTKEKGLVEYKTIKEYILVHKYCLLLLLSISKELLHLISRWNVSLDVLMDYLASPWPCG